MCDLGDSLWESVLDFHPVGPGDLSQIIGLGSKCPSLLSHLGIPLPPATLISFLLCFLLSLFFSYCFQFWFGLFVLFHLGLLGLHWIDEAGLKLMKLCLCT